MKKNRNSRRRQSLIASVILFNTVALAADLPSGGEIPKGVGTIKTDGTTMTVNQKSDKMVVTWDSFNVGAGHTLNFVQPSAQAAVLNRVTGSDLSSIQGAINANGRVFLVNPNGILFTSTAQVNVGSMVASTLSLTTKNFMDGVYSFDGDSTNAVTNQGNITAVGGINNEGVYVGGTVALIAARIINQGTLTAERGNVLMGAGQKVILDFGGPVKIEVEKGALEALIEQNGVIKADGGLVYLTAKATGSLIRTVIKHTGITEAQTLRTGENGKIYLMGDMVNDDLAVSGILDASAPTDGHGGFIETSAATVTTIDGRKVTTLAANGNTGTYLISRNDVVIGAGKDNLLATQLEKDLASTNVTIRTPVAGTPKGNGDIIVNDKVNWSANTLTLIAERHIDINAPMLGSASSKLALHYGQGSLEEGNTAALTIHASVGLPEGDNYNTKLGSDGAIKEFRVIHQLGNPKDAATGASTLQGMAATANLDKNFALGADIDASTTSLGAGFQPIGSTKVAYTGHFDGLGNEISGLHIRHQENGTGLFGVASGTAHIANVGLTNVKIDFVSQEQKSVGALVGDNSGRITNSYATGDIWGNTFTGGLVGWNQRPGVIERSYFAGDVYSGNRVGGLAGVNMGTIAQSYSSGTVLSLFQQDFVGGLVGMNSGNITESYTSAAAHNSSKNKTGHFAGSNDGTITNSYWDASIKPTSDLAGIGAGTLKGASALDETQMRQSANFIGWDFANTWYAQDGDSAPLLRAFLKPLTISATDVVKTYDAQVFHDTSALTFTTHSPFDQSQLLGNVSYGSVSNVAPDASSTGYKLSASGLYTAQQGYIIEYVPGGSLTVNQAVINLDGSRSYDRGTTFSQEDFGVNGIINGLDGQTLTLTGAGSVTSKDVITGGLAQQILNTGTLALASGTGKASNYMLMGGTHYGTITPRSITATGSVAADKTYDATTTATIQNTALTGLVAGEMLTVYESGVFSNKNVGTHDVNVSVGLGDSTGGLASNYALSNAALTVNGTITPKAITATGSVAADKTYDATTTATIQNTALTGLVAGEMLTVVESGVFSNKNVGTHDVNVSVGLGDGTGGLASNYILSNAALTVNGTITPKALTATGSVAADKTYDATTTATIQNTALTGLVAGEMLTVVESGVFSNKNVGTHDVNVSVGLGDGTGGLASNYTLSNAALTVNGTITPRALTVKADDASKTQFSSDPAFTWHITNGNVAPPDTFESLTSRVLGESEGYYPIWVQLLDNPNYQVTTLPGILTISPSSASQRAAIQSAIMTPNDQNIFAQFETDAQIQSEGLVFVPVDASADSDSQSGRLRIFMVGTGVNFGGIVSP